MSCDVGGTFIRRRTKQNRVHVAGVQFYDLWMILEEFHRLGGSRSPLNLPKHATIDAFSFFIGRGIRVVRPASLGGNRVVDSRIFNAKESFT